MVRGSNVGTSLLNGSVIPVINRVGCGSLLVFFLLVLEFPGEALRHELLADDTVAELEADRLRAALLEVLLDRRSRAPKD